MGNAWNRLGKTEDCTSLADAAKGGNLENVRRLMLKGENYDAKNGFGSRMLIQSARQGDLDVVQYLVKQGATLEATNDCGRTPLGLSAEGGHLGVVQYLVKRDAALEATDDNGKTPLILSAEEGHLDVVQFLVEGGAILEATDNDGRTPLISSAERGHLDVVQFLVKRGAELEAMGNKGRTPLILSAWCGHLDVTRFLVDRGAALEASNTDGRTALMLSAERGHLDVVRFLVERGAELEATDRRGKTPLIRGVISGNLDIVRYLVECGALLGATEKGQTPLIVSAKRGSLDIVRFLVEQGAALEVMNYNGSTPLIQSALKGQVDVLRYILERGANVSVVDDFGDTPLICLLRSCLKEDILLPVVHRLLSYGASPDHRNKGGVSAMDIAREKGFYQLEQLLQELSKAERSSATELKSCKTPTSENEKILHTLASVGHVLSSNDSRDGDIHDPRQVEGTAVSGVTSSNSSSIHPEVGTIHKLPEMSSLPISNVTNETEGTNADSLLTILGNMENRCISMNEAAPLYQNILLRLQNIATTVITTDPGDEASVAILAEVRVISTRLKSLLDSNVNIPIVLRLVSIRTVVETLTSLQTDLDRVETRHSGRKMHEWSSQWEEQVAEVKQSIVVLTEASLPMLVEELSSDELEIEAMTLLLFELNRHERYYSRQERDLMQLVHSRIVGYSKLQAMNVEGWFVPRHEVNIDLGDSVGRGSFGKVYRGVWRKSEVVVKMVTSNSEEDKRNFFREVAVWHRIQHPNIVRFLGACHLSSPYFMVCEYAPGGSLPEYLYRERQNGKALVWRKLHEVSLGLFYLHKEGIVHGDLKGDNILVAKDGTVMLTDFGLSFVQSATVATLEKWGAIRWRAPEYAVQGEPGPSFAADVYSLAMVIVEAVTGEAPWGFMPDSAVIWCLRKKEMLKRPINCVEMTDEAWDLVSRMSVYEPSDRMPLDAVVDRLNALAENEEDREWQNRAKRADSY